MKIATSPIEPVAVITTVWRMVEPVTKRAEGEGFMGASALLQGREPFGEA